MVADITPKRKGDDVLDVCELRFAGLYRWGVAFFGRGS